MVGGARKTSRCPIDGGAPARVSGLVVRWRRGRGLPGPKLSGLCASFLGGLATIDCETSCETYPSAWQVCCMSGLRFCLVWDGSAGGAFYGREDNPYEAIKVIEAQLSVMEPSKETRVRLGRRRRSGARPRSIRPLPLSLACTRL